MIKELTELEYKNTFSQKMIKLEEVDNPVNIWPYVNKLVKENIVREHVFENNLIEITYRNNINTFDHILLPTNCQNKYTVIIVDLQKSNIYGHYSLNLNEKYELS